jgi:hypothetical protein
MIRKSLKTTITCLLLLCALSGCSDNDRKKRSALPATQQSAGGTGTQTTAAGTVSQLIGDDDSEVSPQLQQLVADAVVLGDSDEPRDF